MEWYLLSICMQKINKYHVCKEGHDWNTSSCDQEFNKKCGFNYYLEYSTCIKFFLIGQW